ncbi:MAG TPA: hypothetical protein VHZ78_06920 [Rhizomicrobium sp.]|jgi:hypothetical protein|nr:hypothetical protein [Rhizomicrobium sp.]
MGELLQTARPLLLAFAATGLAIAAFAGLSRAGFTTETSLIGALAVAGILNVYGLASLNGAVFPPTSLISVGESQS